MATKTIAVQIKTEKTIDEIKAATRETFRTLGGIVRDTAYGFDIEGGSAGVSLGFVANIRAAVSVVEQAPGTYQVAAVVVWSPNVLVWICLVVGWFVLGLAWIISALYLFVDPAPTYFRTLAQVERILHAGSASQPVAPALAASAAADEDIAQKLRKLQEMHAGKLITAQEYEAKKAELLAKM